MDDMVHIEVESLRQEAGSFGTKTAQKDAKQKDIKTWYVFGNLSMPRYWKMASKHASFKFLAQPSIGYAKAIDTVKQVISVAHLLRICG